LLMGDDDVAIGPMLLCLLINYIGIWVMNCIFGGLWDLEALHGCSWCTPTGTALLIITAGQQIGWRRGAFFILNHVVFATKNKRPSSISWLLVFLPTSFGFYYNRGWALLSFQLHGDFF